MPQPIIDAIRNDNLHLLDALVKKDPKSLGKLDEVDLFLLFARKSSLLIFISTDWKYCSSFMLFK